MYISIYFSPESNFRIEKTAKHQRLALTLKFIPLHRLKLCYSAPRCQHSIYWATGAGNVVLSYRLCRSFEQRWSWRLHSVPVASNRPQTGVRFIGLSFDCGTLRMGSPHNDEKLRLCVSRYWHWEETKCSNIRISFLQRTSVLL